MNQYLFYDDLFEFWKAASQNSKAYIQSSRVPKDSWSGDVTWEEAKQLALHGWKDGLEEVDKYRVQMQPFITEKILRPLQVYSVSGYHVDVGAFLSNDPACFISRVYEERNYPGKIFKIVCSISFSASIQPKTIIQRGAMICALIDGLEYAGHRAEVVCNFSSIDRYPRYALRYSNEAEQEDRLEIDVVVKRSDQPAELSSLAFCLAHPAMLRRMVFSIAEQVGWSDLARDYGYPVEATDRGDIYIQEIFSGKVSDAEAIDWILSELKKMGIDLETN